jgi:hypothetical protein
MLIVAVVPQTKEEEVHGAKWPHRKWKMFTFETFMDTAMEECNMSKKPTRLYFHLKHEAPLQSVATGAEFKSFLRAFATGDVALHSKYPSTESSGGLYSKAHAWVWTGPPGSAPHTPEQKTGAYQCYAFACVSCRL